MRPDAHYRWETEHFDGGRFLLVELPVHTAPRDPYPWLPSFGDAIPLLDLEADPSWRARRDELFQ